LSIAAAAIAAIAVPCPFWSEVFALPSRTLWPGTNWKSAFGTTPLSITAITTDGSPWVSAHASPMFIEARAGSLTG